MEVKAKFTIEETGVSLKKKNGPFIFFLFENQNE
jgi:hypothetical protein